MTSVIESVFACAAEVGKVECISRTLSRKANARRSSQ